VSRLEEWGTETKTKSEGEGGTPALERKEGKSQDHRHTNPVKPQKPESAEKEKRNNAFKKKRTARTQKGVRPRKKRDCKKGGNPGGTPSQTIKGEHQLFNTHKKGFVGPRGGITKAFLQRGKGGRETARRRTKARKPSNGKLDDESGGKRGWGTRPSGKKKKIRAILRVQRGRIPVVSREDQNRREKKLF